jgi:hypothetical protein
MTDPSPHPAIVRYAAGKISAMQAASLIGGTRWSRM